MVPEIEKYIDLLRSEGDSVGAKIQINAKNMPLGLGEPVFDKLDADLAKALMSLPAAKGFEIGSGFAGTFVNVRPIALPFTHHVLVVFSLLLLIAPYILK